MNDYSILKYHQLRHQELAREAEKMKRITILNARRKLKSKRVNN